MTKDVSNLDTSNISNSLQLLNIYSIFATLDVSNKEGSKSKDVKLIHESNMFFILTTLDVSKFDIFI